jgi:hypothetical protein
MSGSKSLSIRKAIELLRLPGARLMKMHNGNGGQDFFVMPGSSRYAGGRVDSYDAHQIIKRQDVFVLDPGLLNSDPQSWGIA